MKNNTRDFIYLASQSASRKQLLDLADIPYKTISHTSDEVEVDTSPEFRARVLAIAQGKMKTILGPDYDYTHGTETGHNDRPIFILTADTLIRSTKSNQVFSKPRDINHAREMIGILRNEPAEVVTGCCLEKRVYEDGIWRVLEHLSWTTSSIAEFIIDESMVDRYFEKTPFFLNISAGCAIEGFGQSFLKTVHGSYTGILGLPLFELRQALKRLDFKF